MLASIDLNLIPSKMADQKLQLAIHRTNLFSPRPLSVSNITPNVLSEFLALTREYSNQEIENDCSGTGIEKSEKPVNIIEIYKVNLETQLVLTDSFIQYERISGIAWVNTKVLLTVSRDQTINLFHIPTLERVSSTLTDYGPILCMKYMQEEKVLFTGTQYGYVAAYYISLEEKNVVFISKLVKINGPVNCVEARIRRSTKEQVENKPIERNKVNILPGKRKRGGESDNEESKEDDAVEGIPKMPWDNFEFTIFGSCKNEVVVWNFKSKTILETLRIGDTTCLARSILALKSGDILVSDSKGTVSLFDTNTFSCKQSINMFDYDILCLTKDACEKTILAAGKSSAILILKVDKVDGTLKLREKVELVGSDVKAILFLYQGHFITGGSDGFLTRFKYKSGEGSRKTLHRSLTIPNYHNHIKFYKAEMMIQYDRSLDFWKLPIGNQINSLQEEEEKPIKTLTLKAKMYVQASAFTDKWVAFSTRRNLHIFKRVDNKLLLMRLNSKLPGCILLELCPDSALLVAATRGKIHFISLENVGADKTSATVESSTMAEQENSCSLLGEHSTDSVIRHIMYIPEAKQLLVGSGNPKKAYITKFNLNQLDFPKILKSPERLVFKKCGISLLTHNVKDDSSVYFFTIKNQIILLNLNSSHDHTKILTQQKPVEGLPHDVVIVGMLLLDNQQCILYNTERIFRVDLVSNRVVGENSSYQHIIKMDNHLFEFPSQITLVELNLKDYCKALPLLTKDRKKFGQ